METKKEVEVNVGKTNSWRNSSGVRYVAIECPKCGEGGGHPIYSYQPNCPVCHKHDNVETKMEPSWHSGITGTWDDAVKHFKELDKSLGYEIKA